MQTAYFTEPTVPPCSPSGLMSNFWAQDVTDHPGQTAQGSARVSGWGCNYFESSWSHPLLVPGNWLQPNVFWEWRGSSALGAWPPLLLFCIWVWKSQWVGTSLVIFLNSKSYIWPQQKNFFNQYTNLYSKKIKVLLFPCPQTTQNPKISSSRVNY